MLRIQNIVPKHFIYYQKVNENTLRRGISFINLVTRDEITNSVPSSLNFISVNNIICCLDVDHLDDRCDVCAVVYFRIIDFMIFRRMTIHMSCNLLVDVNPTFPSNMNSITNYVLFIVLVCQIINFPTIINYS